MPYDEVESALGNTSSFKQGCTSTEAAVIKLRLSEGSSAHDLSQEMRIVESCIQSFIVAAEDLTVAEKVELERSAKQDGFFGKKKK